MAFDDPVVWVLILVVVVVLFGASRIPKFARALGEAKAEFSKGSQSGGLQSSTPPPAPMPMQAPMQAASAPAASAISGDEPLYAAAEKEGIDIRGKTKSEIATELAWKLSKKQQ